VAVRLSAALSQLGWDSRVSSAMESDLRANPFQLPLHTLGAAVDNVLVTAPGFPSLVSLVRDSRNADLAISPDADVFHLHWVNGVTPHNRFAFPPNASIVWTLHDMNPFTGACHHSFGCEAFARDCAQCPAVRRIFQPAVERNLQIKKQNVAGWPSLSVVSPSTWLANLAGTSSLFKDRDISVIANPLDGAFFAPKPAQTADTRKARSHVFAVVASNLDDPIKDVAFAVESFTGARIQHPQIRLLLVGQGGQQFAGIPGVELRGAVSTTELIVLLDETGFLVIPSKAENSPSVAYEAASRGVVPLVRNTGGLPEVVERLREGHLFEDVRDLKNLLSSLANDPPLSSARQKTLMSRVRALSHPETVARHYMELYEGKP